jgi:hypothetical protein
MNIVFRVGLLVLTALLACGPSSAEIRDAKEAAYSGSPGEIFDIVEQTVAETYKIGEAQRSEQYILATQPQWYSPEGGRQSAGPDDFVQLSDRSIQLTLIVEVVGVPERILITITPRTFQNVSGSPKPRELTPDDPNLPPWVTGRVDSLFVEVHKRLQKFKKS